MIKTHIGLSHVIGIGLGPYKRLCGTFSVRAFTEMDIQAMLSFTAFRIIALLEGVSFLLLLGVAMPLKYIYMTPLAVQVIGPIHGLLFMLFCAYLIMILKRHTLPAKVGAWGFLAGILPFGTLVLDGYIKKQVAGDVRELI